MSQFTISRDNLETMYLEGHTRFITSLVDKYKNQILRTNAKGMKTCTCYFADEDLNIIYQVVDKLKAIFIDSSFQIVRAYINCGEIIVHWGKVRRTDTEVRRTGTEVRRTGTEPLRGQKEADFDDEDTA